MRGCCFFISSPTIALGSVYGLFLDEVSKISVECSPKITGERLCTKATDIEPRTKATSKTD